VTLRETFLTGSRFTSPHQAIQHGIRTLEEWSDLVLAARASTQERRRDSAKQQFNLEPRHLEVLAVLEHGPVARLELGKRLGKPVTTVFDLVRALERAGVVGVHLEGRLSVVRLQGRSEAP
jgi:predicted Rossmann fold nucleotide-binding protein DprA/Smf involved in DNA uptake